MKRHVMARCAWAILAVVGTLSCDGGPMQPGAVVARVEISPEAPSIEAGAAEQLQVTLFDPAGNPVSGRRVVWDSDNSAVVQVSGSGMITGVAPGRARVSASSDGESDIVEVRVLPPSVATVTVTPPSPAVQVGATVQLQAAARSAAGIALTDRPVSWESRNPAVARVDASTGLVTGLLPGQAEIVATVGGRTGSTTATVAAASAGSAGDGGTTRSGTPGSPLPDSLAVRLLDVSGRGIPGVTVTWTVAPGSGSVSPATSTTNGEGIAKTQWTLGTAAGEQQVTATAPGIQPIAFTAQTTPAAVATVTVDPASHTFTGLGQTQRFSAVARDAAGNTLSGRAVVWSSSAPGVASVASDGTVTAVSNGTATVTATVEGRTGTASVAVNQPPPSPAAVARVSVEPGSVTLTSFGDTRRFSALAYDAAGNVLTGRPVSWSSSAPGVVSVGGDGTATARANGTATITANVEGVTSTATVTVSQQVASVGVAPGSAELNTGETRQLTATARDAGGSVIAGASFSWTSSSPTIATVNATGVVTGVAPGQATITATAGGRSGSAVVTVVAPAPATVATVTVEPASHTFTALGQTQRLSAIARDAAGNVLTGRPVAWSSSAPAVASIAADGTVTAVSNGNATITATVEGKTGTSAVTVNQPPPPPAAVTSVTVEPGSATLTSLGATQRFSAIARDAAGNALTGRSVLWSSSAPAVASIAADGTATAVSNGTATITATVDGVRGTATLTVSQQVASVGVAPGSAELNTGETRQLTATARDAGGSVIAGASFSWTSSSPTIATVNATGVVTGVAPGQATITATAGGRSGSAVVTVVAAIGAPARLVIVSGDGQEGDNGKVLEDPLVVRVTDGAGRPVPNLRVQWLPQNGLNASATPSESLTDGQGRAFTRWNIGGGSTRQRTLKASLPDHPGIAPVIFTATRD